MYIAPAYFIYLLKHYCFAAQTEGGSIHAPKMKDFLLKNFIKLGARVAAVFAFSFGPFIYMVSALNEGLFNVAINWLIMGNIQSEFLWFMKCDYYSFP